MLLNTVEDFGDRATMERAAALYLPVCAGVVGWFFARPKGRVFAACLLGLLWSLSALLLLQRVNLVAGWWTYIDAGPRVLAMPFELWIGWAVLWGVTPALALSRLSVVRQCLVLGLFDTVAMPLCRGTVQLGPRWALGECVALAGVLFPSLLLQRWTMQGERVKGRAGLQVLTAALIFLYLPAELVFDLRGGPGWDALRLWPGWALQLLVQCGVLLALPGISAVQEFATRGDGTPIPYDPPQRLVTTGIYRYLANPMQTSCALTMVLWAVLLRSPWLMLGPVVCVVYSAGIARWDEAQDLRWRFAAPWMAYRAQVRDWAPRWRPSVAGEPAILHVARGCEACSAVRRWLERRVPVNIRIVDAETLPAGSISRMRYVCGDDRADGVRAFARALEHLHLGWALAGAALRLLGVWQVAQSLMDASGFGPRTLVCSTQERGLMRKTP